MITLDIPAAVTKAKAKKIRVSPCHTNRASSLGDPCERRLVYERTSWEEKRPHDVGLQYIFDEGNLQEKAVIRDLEDAGIEVEQQQADFNWRVYQITGHLDGFIRGNGTKVPVEIKSMSPYIWRTIDTMEDLQKFPWTKRYMAQVVLYLLMSNKEEGILLLKNKSTGQIKQINIALDYDLAEELIQKAERINAHIEAGTLPDFVEDKSNCPECPFVHICNPPLIYGDELDIITDQEIILKLDRLDEIHDMHTEYDRLKKSVKAALGDRRNVMAGNWAITVKDQEKKGYTVEPKTVRRYNIIRIPDEAE